MLCFKNFTDFRKKKVFRDNKKKKKHSVSYKQQPAVTGLLEKKTIKT